MTRSPQIQTPSVQLGLFPGAHRPRRSYSEGLGHSRRCISVEGRDYSRGGMCGRPGEDRLHKLVRAGGTEERPPASAAGKTYHSSGERDHARIHDRHSR